LKPDEHQVNTTFQSVIGNSIFAVCGWFLKAKKSSLRRSPRNATSDFTRAFCSVHGVGFVKPFAFPI
jgi:hypothetical protein